MKKKKFKKYFYSKYTKNLINLKRKNKYFKFLKHKSLFFNFILNI
jgi:hypothetical protein